MAGFVKLDAGILHSSLWSDRDARDVFVTALLMARPHEFKADEPELKTRSLEGTGWSIPAGWYGFVEAASLGIIRQAGLHREEGMAALERLAAADPESRSQVFEGRRLVRVDGGFVVLNYIAYRDRDYTAAERMRRFRERQKQRDTAGQDVTERDVTRNDTPGNACREQMQRSQPEEDPDRTRRSDPVARAREREASPIADAESRRKLARALLLRGYQERFERVAGLWGGAPGNSRSIDEVAAWLARHDGDLAPVAEAMLDGVFADEYLSKKRWPWSMIAKDPGRFLEPPPGRTPIYEDPGYSDDDIPPAPARRRHA